MPFTIAGGLIYTTAILDGKPERCMVDTGSHNISWPASLNLPGTSTGTIGMDEDGDARTVENYQVIMGRIQLGSYVLLGAATYACFVPLTKSGQFNPILLGNPAFENAVLTIDYHRRRLIISRDYRSARAINGLDTTLAVPMCPYEILPAIRVKLYGRHYTFVLDTGTNASGIALSDKLFRRIAFKDKTRPKAKSALAQFRFEKVPLPYLASVDWSIDGRGGPSISVRSAAVDDKFLPSGVDGIMGTVLLENSRVIIDYPNRIIYFEPYRPKRTLTRPI